MINATISYAVSGTLRPLSYKSNITCYVRHCSIFIVGLSVKLPAIKLITLLNRLRSCICRVAVSYTV